MTYEERVKRADRLRALVKQEVADSNIRAVARRAGVPHGTLGALTRGTVPQARVLDTLEGWVEREGLVLNKERESVQDAPGRKLETVGALSAEGSEVVLRQFEKILEMPVPAPEKMELLRLHALTVREANKRGEIVAAERRAFASILEAQNADNRILIGASDEGVAALAAQGHAAAVAAGGERERAAG